MRRSKYANGFSVALILVAIYVALRTVSAPEPVVLGWSILAVAAAAVSPLAGLTILAAIGPFTEALAANGEITAVPFLLAATGIGTVVQMVALRQSWRLSWPVALGLVVFIGTAVSVAHSLISFGQSDGVAAAELWVPGIGGALTVLFAATWLGAHGEVRPLAVAVSAVAFGALLTTVDYVANGIVFRTPLSWLLHAAETERASGIILAPNAAATIFLVAIAPCLAVVVLDHERRTRALAALGGLIALIALVFTFSRSGFVAVGIVVTVVAYARWRRTGLLLAAVAIAVAVVAVLTAGSFREVKVVADQDRVIAWQAAIRLWAENPLVGAGFRSFEWLHTAVGSPVLNAPHNEWLRVFAEEGTFVGAAAAAFAILTPVWLLRRRTLVAVAAAATAASVFFMACFNNPFLYTQVNVPVFIVIGTGVGFASRYVSSARAAVVAPPAA